MSNCNDSINIRSANSPSWNAAAAPSRFLLPPQGWPELWIRFNWRVVIAGCRSEPTHPRSEQTFAGLAFTARGLPASGCEHRPLVPLSVQETPKREEVQDEPRPGRVLGTGDGKSREHSSNNCTVFECERL